MQTSLTRSIRRVLTGVIGAAVTAGSSGAIAGTAAATDSTPVAAAPPGLTVSYTAPPPTLVLTPYASMEIPAVPDRGTFIPGVAVLADGGAVVLDREAEVAYLVGSDGSTSPAPALDAYPSSIVATAGPVVYGFIVDPAGDGFGVGAVALAGPNAGRVVSSGPAPDPSLYLELPVGALGNGPGGVVDRSRSPGAVLAGHVDTAGTPVTIEGLRAPLTITDTLLVTDGANPERSWQLAIERHPEATAPYAGESPPAPGVGGTSVYWTSIGPPSQLSDPLSPGLQSVIAVLWPDGTGRWYSIPEGWFPVSSDVGGTLFARRPEGSGVVELARLDTAATGPAPAAIPPLAAQCDDYEFNNQYPLRRCDSGPAVRIVQQQLQGIDPNLSDDGFFGPLTNRAVRRFQRANGLEVDGLVGRNTWRALTEGEISGTDADGSGVVDPSEIEQAAVAGFPPVNTAISQGGTTWAVVLAGSADFEDPALLVAMNVASDVGYSTGPTDCDVGAAQALGIDSEIVYTVSVYYATEADARTAQAAFAVRGQAGVVAEVETFCLD